MPLTATVRPNGMRYHDTILEAIGGTPLVKLNSVAAGIACTVLVKVEGLNPGGSVKDRPATFMLEQAEKKGLIKPGGTIVEPTSGNTGIGLAQAAAVKGYRCIFVMPDKMSEDKVRLLQAYGAEVVITPTNVENSDPRSYYSVANRLTEEIPGAYQPNQFANLDNPLAHELSTGPEIWEDTAGKITHFVASMGTGGTLSGSAKYLKGQKPGVVVVAADPLGSTYSGGEAGPYLLEGVGMSCIPPTADVSLVDRFETVDDREAFAMARRLTREEGIFAGGSAGLVVAGALRVARELPADAVVVALLPSNGRSYVSKLYSDTWMREQGMLEAPNGAGKLADLLRNKPMLQPLVSVPSDAPVARAAALLRQYNVSQLPVIDGEAVVGSIQEADVLRLVMEGMDLGTTPVRLVMGRPFPALGADSNVQDACFALAEGSDTAIVVLSERRPVGVLTKIDFIHHLSELVGAKS